MHPCVCNYSLPVNCDLECPCVSQSFAVHPKGETQMPMGSIFLLFIFPYYGMWFRVKLIIQAPLDSGALMVTLVFFHVLVNTGIPTVIAHLHAG